MSAARLLGLSLLALTAIVEGDLRAEGQPHEARHQFTQVHMGMPVRIVLYATGEAPAARVAGAAFARIAALDAMMSDYRADSELRRLEPLAWRSVSRELFDVLEQAVALARATRGAFDPTVGPLVALWREVRQTRRLPDSDRLNNARARVGWRHVQLDRRRRAVRLDRAGMQLDLGGIAKGWILQDARRVLYRLRVRRVLLEAGGDIVVGDPPPGQEGWQIETPGADAAFARRASRLARAALATSGSTAQFVEIAGVRYSHVVDPRSGVGLTNGAMANVIASNAATADALATALTVLGPERGREVASRFPGVLVSVYSSDAGLQRLPELSSLIDARIFPRN